MQRAGDADSLIIALHSNPKAAHAAFCHWGSHFQAADNTNAAAIPKARTASFAE